MFTEEIQNISVQNTSISTVNSDNNKVNEVEPEIETQKIVINTQSNEYAVPEDLPREAFNFEQMIEHWDFIADRFYTTGRMLMYSTMKMSVPQLNGSSITIELPNEGSKISFEENKYDLVNYLRKKLNNYDIEIQIIVNEEIKIKKAFTIEDKFKFFSSRIESVMISQFA